jgi:hypothetical protein
MYWSELDRYGNHTYSVWLKTFSLLDSDVDGNLAAGFAHWVGWSPHLVRL